MAGLFISHSSIDKPFVNKLSIDLINRGFPVWYDLWEISIADSLIDKIFDSLDESFFLILILSKNSVRSKWVTKELNAALNKEDELKRKFVIPIKIDDCEIPLKILDRVFLDFSKDYMLNMEILESELIKWKVDQIEIPMSNRLIPLKFFKYIDVDTNIIEIFFKNKIKPNGYMDLININQIIIMDEPITKTLKERLFKRIDNIENDPYYSPELYKALYYEFDNLKKLELLLKNGVCSIINNYNKTNSHFYLNETLYWFCKLIRSRIMYTLWNTQVPETKNLEIINFEKEILAKWKSAFFISNILANKFFEINNAQILIIGDAGYLGSVKNEFSIWMDGDKPSIKEHLGYQNVENAYDILNTEDFSKFVIPQMLLSLESNNYIWSLSEKVICLP